jgi:hypothetical protein
LSLFLYLTILSIGLSSCKSLFNASKKETRKLCLPTLTSLNLAKDPGVEEIVYDRIVNIIV